MRDRVVVWVANLVLLFASRKYREYQQTIQELGWDAYMRLPRGYSQPRRPAPIYGEPVHTRHPGDQECDCEPLP